MLKFTRLITSPELEIRQQSFKQPKSLAGTPPDFIKAINIPPSQLRTRIV